mgnify:CR=1 FL=1
MPERNELTMALVGYQVRQSDRRTAVGEIEGVAPRGVRVHKIPGRARHPGFLPVEAIASIDRSANTIILAPAIGLAEVADAPSPPEQSAEGWHTSADWWADLLGHYGLFECEGRGNEPLLHPDQS